MIGEMITVDNRDFITEYLEVSKQVCDRPCWVKEILLIAKGVGNIYTKVIDGFGSGDYLKLTIRAASRETEPVVFRRPLRFSRGLYLVVDFSAGCVVSYLPDY